eukprot:Skav224334  [mRNA]  locus=scaffold1353:253005:254854:- [translate_table: standard]
MLFIMVAGYSPFDAPEVTQIYKNIIKGREPQSWVACVSQQWQFSSFAGTVQGVMAVNPGNVLAYASCATSLVTVLIGAIYAYWHFPPMSLMFSSCGWQDPDEYTYWVDCNSKWAQGWGIFGIVTWIPLIFGLIGTMMVNPMVLEVVGFPRNFLQHGSVFLVLQGMMGNVGFCGKLGVVTGFASLAMGCIDIFASAFHIKSDRMKELQRLKDHRGLTSRNDFQCSDLKLSSA